MKKILIILFAVFMLSACSSSSNSLKSMNYQEFKEKIENKESFVAYVSRTGCSYCESYEPTLLKVLKDYNIVAYKINLANLTSAEEKSVSKKVGLKGTPTLIYLEEGKSDIDGALIGENTYENTVDFFKENGMIKE